jgi:hypothetical protein
VTCFGCTSGPGIFGRVGDAIVKIFHFHGITDLIKWVDDFVFFRYAFYNKSSREWAYKYDASLIWRVAEVLGWPWAHAKFFDFTYFFSYVGFVWDLDQKVVYLASEKCQKFIDRLIPWVANTMVTKNDCDVLVGTLNHCALILPDGRSHLPSFYRLSGSFKNCHYLVKHRVSITVASDAAWWRDRLSAERCEMKIRELPPASPDQIFVDASTSWGIGFVLAGKWLAWKLKPGWKAGGRDIGWAEMVAVELAVTVLIALGLNSVHFILRSDNQGVCGATAGGKSRNPEQNDILRRTVELFRDNDIWFTIEWVSTHNNPADDPSRGKLPPLADIISVAPILPFHLRQFVEKPVRTETYSLYKLKDL